MGVRGVLGTFCALMACMMHGAPDPGGVPIPRYPPPQQCPLRCGAVACRQRTPGPRESSGGRGHRVAPRAVLRVLHAPREGASARTRVCVRVRT
eukprot:gene14697-biopygen11168